MEIVGISLFYLFKFIILLLCLLMFLADLDSCAAGVQTEARLATVLSCPPQVEQKKNQSSCLVNVYQHMLKYRTPKALIIGTKSLKQK